MRAWVMAAVLLLVSGAFGAVQAQALPPGAGGKPAAAAPAVPDNLKPAEVDGFVAGLTDAQSRQVLLDRLRQSASAAEPREPDAMLDFAGMLRAARDAAARLGERTEQALAALPGAPDALAKAFELMTDLEGTAALPMAGLALLTMLLVGAALEWLVRRRFSARIERDPTSDGLAHRTALMLCASDVIAIVLFGLGAFLTSFAFFERFHPMREALIAAVILIVVVRLAYALARLLLGNQSAGPAQALPPLQVSMVVGFVAFGAVSLGLLKLYGFPPELLTLCQAAWGTLALIPLLLMVARAAHRPVVVEAGPTAGEGVLDDVASRIGTGIGRTWRRLAVPALLLLWLVWLVDLLLGYGEGMRHAVVCALCIIGMPAVDQIVASIFGPQARSGQGKWRGVARMLRVAGHVALAATAIVLLIESLSFGALSAIFGPLASATIVTALSDSFIAILVAAIAWELVEIYIRRTLSEDSGDVGASVVAAAEGEGGVAKVGTRAQTLLPLFRVFALIGIVAVAGLAVLSSLGVNIAPLLAGAGVIGIAIGFGAQSLVRDVVSGIFFLIDDAFRVGEYIEFGRTRGEIEKLSIRSLSLRHHRGAVHTVPFGELRTVTNHSRDWTIMKLEMGLRYGTDPAKVKKIVKKIGAELMEDPVHGRNFIEPLKSQGILRFGDSAVIMRVKFMCRPREQFVLRRVINEKLQAAFAENGIEFAYPTVTVLADDPSDQTAIDGAAAAIVTAPKPAPPPPT